ncbi:hypothetical protein UFOVP150_40 [uncultured Caudovirales phage]|uniref:Uncharacterized protein n=1 Tax=uncultured Caudovirales phage TaxID=2100421 RepID=A0A6J7WAU4_9CAUD|nr:hypothetical protein UFOVP150_40 [uncultured Caudovirales phage]
MKVTLTDLQAQKLKELQSAGRLYWTVESIQGIRIMNQLVKKGVAAKVYDSEFIFFDYVPVKLSGE